MTYYQISERPNGYHVLARDNDKKPYQCIAVLPTMDEAINYIKDKQL